MAGSSTSPRSHSCGVVAASSALSSSRISPQHTARTPTSRTFCSTTSSTRPSTRLNLAGETSSPRGLSGAFPHLHSPPLSASSTDTVQKTYQPTCCKLNVTTSALTPSSSSLSLQARNTPKESTSTSTGLEGEAMSRLRHTLRKVGCSFLLRPGWIACP
jgi:hypothetical protein